MASVLPLTTTFTPPPLTTTFTPPPLTTIFTPPASCLSVTTSLYPDVLCIGGCFDYGLNCVPGGDKIPFYSPGICPSGFTNAIQFTDSKFLAGWVPTLATHTYTASLCCPSGFSFINSQGCISSAATVTNVWIAPITPIQAIPSSLQLTTMAATGTNGWYVGGRGIVVLWESTDTEILALLSSISAASGSSAAIQSSWPSSSRAITASFTSKSTLPINTSRAPASSSTRLASSHGTSQGTKIAIGVTIPVVFVLIILGFFLFFRRRGKAAAAFGPGESQQHTNTTESYVYPIRAELSAGPNAVPPKADSTPLPLKSHEPVVTMAPAATLPLTREFFATFVFFRRRNRAARAMSHPQLESSAGDTLHIPELGNTGTLALPSENTPLSPQPWDPHGNSEGPQEPEMPARIELDGNRQKAGPEAAEPVPPTTTRLSSPPELGSQGISAEAGSTNIHEAPPYTVRSPVSHELQTISPTYPTVTLPIKRKSLVPSQRQQRTSSFPEPWAESSSGVEYVPTTVSPPKAVSPQTAVSSLPVAASPTTATDAHLDHLHEKREKIRPEKERLQKLQRLEDMEAEVQREIETREAELAGRS